LNIENYLDVGRGRSFSSTENHGRTRINELSGKTVPNRVHPWLIVFVEPELLFNARRDAAPNRNIMETVETLKAEVKKLSSQAIQTKMDLHDLSEELPTNWERIPEVAQKTFQIYEKLIAAKQKLAVLGG
jgi:hypothetical protein